MKSETASNCAKTFQCIVVAISIPVAGYWTYNTFDTTKQAKMAQAQYEKLSKDIEDKRSVVIQLTPNLHNDSEKQIIVTTIQIKNMGNLQENISIDDCEFTAYLNKNPSDAHAEILKLKPSIITHPGPQIGSLSIDAHESIKLLSVTAVSAPGMYTFEYKMPAKLSPSEQNIKSIYSETAYLMVPW